jgi:glycosyltransferase involved in cell wall biosynthesis
VRIAIDASPLLVRSAGVKNYLYYWITHLRRLAGDDAVRLFPAIGSLGPLNHEASLASPLRTWAGLASLAAMNYARLPLIDWFGPRAQVFHTSNLLSLPPTRMPLTTTIHDVTSWLMPGVHSAANQRADRSLERTVGLARGIIAVSEHTRQDAIRVLRLPPEKITVIHSGIAPGFFDVTPEAVQAARTALGLDRPYLLCLGTIEPRKNIGRLLDAWGGVAPSLRREFELVVAGPPGWGDPSLMARLRTPTPGLRYLGYIPEEHLPGLTAGAVVFAYPSLYEGFGFPVVQAMAAGVPVLTSNVSSLPEVAGEAAVLIDPQSTVELRDAIERLLLSPGEREQRAALGRTRARQFTWDECARRSLAFFSKVIG